jgi:hypothetical protein
MSLRVMLTALLHRCCSFVLFHCWCSDVFKKQGVPITMQEAREPMGSESDTHRRSWQECGEKQTECGN